MPPLTVAAGEIWDASRYPVADRPGTGDTSDAKIGSDMSAGIRISKETAAGSSAVEKTGTAELIVGAVADGVERLAVSAGTLHLAARQKSLSGPVAMDDDFEVYIPNHSFETPFGADDGANRYYKWPSSTFNGWTKSGEKTWNGVQFVTLYPKITTWTSYDFPDGTNALLIVGAGIVSTEVTVPKAGTYELSFWATSRYGNFIGETINDSIRRGVVDVKFADRTVGRCQVNKGGFAKYRCRFSVAEGETGNVMPLTLAAFQGYSDSCMIVDNLHMRAVPLAERTDTVKVPGGDFEMNDRVAVDGVRAKGFPCVYDRNMCVEGWEFSLTDDALSDNPTNGYVSVVSAATLSWHSTSYRTPFFSWAEGLPGASALSFLGDCGIARSGEFTLPAGRWLLRAKKAFRPACVLHLNPDTGKWVEYHHDYPETELQVYATLERGSGEYALGVAANNEPNPYRPSCMLLPCVWTNVIEVSQDETVRLKLYGKNAGSALLDDFEFVPASGAMPEINLIENPGFELRGAGWASVIPPGDVKYATSTPSYRFPYQTDTYAFGYSVYDGEYCGRLHNRGGVYRTVLFPEPGLYRFTYHARSRSDETYGFNPVFAYVVLADGTTNTVCRTKIPRGQNFVEYSYLFRMPEAGSRTFYIIGEGVPSGNLTEDGKDKANRSTLIDGLSLVKVDESSLTAPQVPDRLRMSVAEGACLVLDYPGTKTVASLTFGGEHVTGPGIVNAESHPEYVSGIGSLTVKPFGTAVIIR